MKILEKLPHFEKNLKNKFRNINKNNNKRFQVVSDNLSAKDESFDVSSLKLITSIKLLHQFLCFL